jgi:hypothetical protein
MVELVNANHEVFPGQSKTVTFTIPARQNKTTAEAMSTSLKSAAAAKGQI